MSIIISQKLFGDFEGSAVTEYSMRNAHGMMISIITYGATVTKIVTPDRNNIFENIVIGFDELEKYTDPNNPYIGATVGRYCNRIADGKFHLDGKEYQLAKNNQGNSLHGGLKGFDKVVWNGKINEEKGAVILSYLSPDEEEGFPGNLEVTVTYTLTDLNELIIDYRAGTDRATPINLTNHSYFDLSGKKSSSILDHELLLTATEYTANDPSLIPTGEIKTVKHTALDFTASKKIGRDILEIGGYDHNMIVPDYDGSSEPKKVATLYEATSGRMMEMFTTEPAVQFYSGNLNPGMGEQAGLCLEAQHYPDSPNQPSFPGTILRPGELYAQTTIYTFRVANS